MPRKYILDAGTALIKVERMAYELLEQNLDEKHVILIGIRENGSVIARTMQRLLKDISSLDVQLIDLYLDKKNPGKVELSGNIPLDNKVIVVVDDVANSGRTMLYSLKPLLEFRPKKIQTLALVARTHKAFPIQLDYTGLAVATTLQEHIYVEVAGETITGAYME